MALTKTIAIEGIDGSGKSVQFKLLKQALENMGYTVASMEFPVYDSFFGKEVGRFLTAADGVRADEVDAKSMALWFAMDRFKAMQGYKDGETDFLVINRYVLSNAVYQSIRDIDANKEYDTLEFVYNLEYNELGLVKPDLNLFFDVDQSQASKNVLKKGFRSYVGEGKDVYEASNSIQFRAREKYLEYADRCDDIKVVSCMEDGVFLAPEVISEKVLEILKNSSII
ncbi:MAG: hypothetical protein IJF80_06260 [Clostridia bacterium]|nr:hypothetical protein [Clostridia bacterium]